MAVIPVSDPAADTTEHSRAALPPLALAGLGSIVRRWWPAAALVGGGVLALDLSQKLSHWLASGTSFTLAAAAGGALWLLRPRRRAALADTDLAGWLARLESLLPQFEALGHGSAQRPHQLSELRVQLDRPSLQLAVVAMEPLQPSLRDQLAAVLRSPAGLTVHWADPLPRWSGGWRWPEPFQQCDLLIHLLQAPLGAAPLRWIEAMPEGQPGWLLVSADPALQLETLRRELLAQLPPGLEHRLLLWDGRPPSLERCLEPLLQGLIEEPAGLRQTTGRRLARQLHGQWQGELELLRRDQLERLLQRTQWLVAAGVVAAPLPSLDLLVLAAANGLMLQEMARLWQCPWTLEQLRAAAAELARACLALGVVEWSSQTLAGLLKLHGATWLVGGAVQALSAAYLTRVVGRAMADVLALSSGVAVPDLERIKREAPLLVARAVESERLDWPSFLQQGRQWLAAAA
ncbi:MAG: YcjF family protein [Cyanobacteriota bacterium]|nr:YcjF family protein [Cyanobacteriota bacterium]